MNSKIHPSAPKKKKEKREQKKCLFCGINDPHEGWTVCDLCYENHKELLDRAANAPIPKAVGSELKTFGNDY